MTNPSVIAEQPKPWLLVVDDQAVISEPIAAFLRTAGFDATSLASGAAVLEVLKTRTPALMILDVHMPGMDGLTLLAGLRSNASTATLPVILLTAEADRRFILQASKLGVKEYLLKSRFSLEELFARVNRALPKDIVQIEPSSGDIQTTPLVQGKAPLAIGPIVALSTREQLIERAHNALEGKALSGMVAEVISMAASPRTSTTDLSAVIMRDPMLSANVLRVANSAAYASAQAIVMNIPEAIRKIGCAAVGRVAAAIAVIDAMPGTASDGFNFVRAWQHSFAVAQLCQQLAPQSSETGGLPYLVGLCHDLTDILFHAHFSEECRKVLEAQQSSGRPRGEIEREMLGMTRGELAPILLSRLGLPETIRSAIEAFHAALAARTPPTQGMARVLWLAELYANGALLASSPAGLVAPITKGFCKKANGDANPPCPDVATLRGEVYCLTTLMARLAPKEEANLAAPLLPTRKVKIWLARDDAFSAFDPMATALGSLSDLYVSSRQPSVSEAKQVDGVVVTTCSASGGVGAAAADIGATGIGRSGMGPLWLATAAPGRGHSNAVGLPISLADLAAFLETVESRSQSLAA